MVDFSTTDDASGSIIDSDGCQDDAQSTALGLDDPMAPFEQVLEYYVYERRPDAQLYLFSDEDVNIPLQQTTNGTPEEMREVLYRLNPAVEVDENGMAEVIWPDHLKVDVAETGEAEA